VFTRALTATALFVKGFLIMASIQTRPISVAPIRVLFRGVESFTAYPIHVVCRVLHALSTFFARLTSASTSLSLSFTSSFLSLAS